MSSTLGKLCSALSFAAMMTKWSLSIVLILGTFVCRVGADFPCKTEQIHWKSSSTLGKRYKCLECPDCPAGSQPSVPCGSSVPYNTAVHCVLCQRSKTYSNRYDKAQCKACTVCSPGKAVIKNCTVSSNTVCDDKCAYGYYSVPFIFDCLQCTECCNDEKDEIANDCATYRKKCKLRATPCKTFGHMTSTALPTTQPATKELVKQTSSLTPTLSGNNSQTEAENKEVKSEEDDSENKTLIIVSTVCALVALFIAILSLIAYTACGKRNTNDIFKCYWDRNSNNDNGMELASQPNPPTSASQEQLNQDDTTLEWLESKHLDLFDWMCLKLDTGRRRSRWDYERLAAKYNRILLEERHSLRGQLQIEGGGPSKEFMKLLQTKYPSLPLRHFVRTLTEIGRNDIAQRLMPYVKQNVNSPSRLVV